MYNWKENVWVDGKHYSWYREELPCQFCSHLCWKTQKCPERLELDYPKCNSCGAAKHYGVLCPNIIEALNGLGVKDE